MNTANKVKKKKLFAFWLSLMLSSVIMVIMTAVVVMVVFLITLFMDKPHSFPFHWPAPWVLHSICPQLNWRKIELNQTMSKKGAVHFPNIILVVRSVFNESSWKSSVK